MAISIDTLRSLDANKTYYIANSTGEIKEAGAWQKFKCLFGIGDGRAKAAKLVDAVKATLLESSDKIGDSALDAGINILKDKRLRFFSVSGRAVAELATNFSAANEADIARVQAGQVARQPLTKAVDEVRSLLRIDTDRPDDVMEILKRAAKPLIDHPPMKEDGTGRRVLDVDKFKTELKKVLDDAEQAMVGVSKSSPSGRA